MAGDLGKDAQTAVERSLDSLSDYLRRGREFKDTDISELRPLYSQAATLATKSWAASDVRRVSDLEAEFDLRNIEPPRDVRDRVGPAIVSKLLKNSELPRQAIQDYVQRWKKQRRN